MSVWAIADLHLSFGVPNKKMDVFGDKWKDHPEKIARAWHEHITKDDLVLIAGDISWAKTLDEAAPDLAWIDSLPGTKVMIRGNHDYWWQAISKVRQALPPSIHALQHDTFVWHDYIIGGTRLWDNIEFGFDSYIPMENYPKANVTPDDSFDPLESEKILTRELGRLRMSLEKMKDSPLTRIAMTHYPPIGPDLAPSRTSRLFEEFHIETVVFGHLHNVHATTPLFGEKEGIRYILTSADTINFVPVKIYT